ncbi:response regulator [Cohnella algarum]|uniref:response regulator n=1 Tax=Cohnella algarum TaxID=2044859 RepID=UPI001967B3E5|nr:response regulator [Cohnella algarum]MBN2983628.1 response regulator [Cohnella algarum]
MYDILIVDDEASVREMIVELVDWNGRGFNCVGHSENGMDALEAAIRLRPDVVLTDICMPFMDGLELARRLSDELPRCRVVFLTGHDDFEYARQAVRLGAEDYLMKPMTAAELCALLDRLRQQLDEERYRLEDMDRLRRQLNESFPVLRERFLERLVIAGVRKGEAEERLAYFGIDLGGPDYVVLAVDPDRFDDRLGAEDRELLRFAVYNIVQELTGAEAAPAVFQSREERVLAVLSGDASRDLEARAQHLAEQIRDAAERYLPITVTSGIGRPACGLRDLPRSYAEAATALEYRLLLGGNRVIGISDMEGRESALYFESAQEEKKLVTAIRTGNASEAEAAISETFARLRGAFPTVERCRIQIQKWIMAIVQTVAELGGDESEAFGHQAHPFDILSSCKTLDEIERRLTEAARRAIAAVSAARTDFCRLQMLNAEAFIRERYGDPELSLKTICRHLHMSTSYFSAEFKRHTGKTFVEYVTAERIAKAKELLKLTDAKTYEIAAKVGYKDPHYFSLIFKKATGETPKEHRQKAAMP